MAALARFYRIAPGEILVVHDELDLKPGSVKLKLGGGSAGHNGLKDVIAQLGTGDYWRLRIGIGHPRDADPGCRRSPTTCSIRRRARGTAADRRRDRARARDLAAARRGDMERAMHELHTRPRRADAATPAADGQSQPATKGPDIVSLKCGIVGLPNVGKSTLFNALTKAGIAAENYPFCTIEPNVGIVEVPDPRLDGARRRS